jgi:hypothetical protein
MKRLIIASCLALAFASAALGSSLSGYTNSGVVLSPPVIEATNFVNLGLFDFATLEPFTFADVQTYTNRGVMYGEYGFVFDTSPATSQDPPEGPAAGFSNQNPGQIYGGAEVPLTNSLEVIDAGADPQLIVNATNIESSGLLDVGATGLISITGNAVDLSRGTVQVEGVAQNGATAATVGLGAGIFDLYWGIGVENKKLGLGNLSLPFPTTPVQNVTNNLLTAETVQFSIENAQAVALTNEISPSNIVVQVILYGDTLGLVNMNAGFQPIAGSNYATSVVTWSSTVTNVYGQVFNNDLYLTDDIGSLTNATEQTNSKTASGRTLLIPTNYTIFRGTTIFSPGNAPYSPGLFANGFSTNNGTITNQYTALGVNVAAVTVQPDPTIAGSTFSNVAGRVQITANTSLNLTSAVIPAGNYLGLTATNHFVGSQGAQITFPYADINLGSTNGQLTITNLVAPFLPNLNGPISCYTAIWTNLTSATNIVITATATNTNTFTVTNEFTVLMVTSSLEPTAPVYVDNLALRSTNVVISDLVNVTSNLFINGQNLTITSNAGGSDTPFGELDLIGAPGIYSANWPVLQNLTNSGLIENDGEPGVSFFQLRQNPNNPTAGDAPWQSVVNHGSYNINVGGTNVGGIVSLGGNIFWANYFENTGTLLNPAFIYSEFGPITVQSTTAVLSNGEVLAVGESGDMSFTSGSLTIATQMIEANGSLALTATNLLTDLSLPADLTDGGSGNEWLSGDGFSLLAAPASGDLLGTAITNSCLAGKQCENTWAGIPDASISTTAGFYTNLLPVMAGNAPLGQLILSGGDTNSIFHFKGLDTVHPYALYVDQIQLQNGATNYGGPVGSIQKFTAFNIDTNVTIYYLDATMAGLDISQKLSQTEPGRIVWLSNYVGRFSYTNITYPDGRTFAFNRALAESETIDSNSNGIPNAFDPAPFPEPPLALTPESIGLVIALATNNSSSMAAISWLAPAYSTNTLYTRTLLNPNWQVRTNFVQGASNSRVTVFDSLLTNHLYKVGIVPFQ